MSHCPVEAGARDPKHIIYIIAVCLSHLASSYSNKSISLLSPLTYLKYLKDQEHFRKIKSTFVEDNKSCCMDGAIFNQIDDKRPYKDGIYLPTCLTETMS